MTLCKDDRKTSLEAINRGFNIVLDVLKTKDADIDRLREALRECGRKADEPATIEMIVREALGDD